MRRPGSVAFLLLFLMISSIARAEECPKNVPPNNVITLTAFQTTVDTYTMVNPMTGKNVVKDSARVEWLTEDDVMNAKKPTGTSVGRFPLTVGYCNTVGDKPIIEFPTAGITPQKLFDASAIAVQYAPTESTLGQPFVRFLRISWSESAKPPAGQEPAPKTETDEAKKDKPASVTYKVVATAGVPDTASDSRYKVWAYTGYTFLRSAKDFKDGYAELLTRVETRWLDAFVAMKRYQPEIYDEIQTTGTHCTERRPTDKEVGTKVKIGDRLRATSNDVASGRAVLVGTLIPATSDDVFTGRVLVQNDVIRSCGIPRLWTARIYGEAGLIGTTVVATDNKGTTVIGGVSQSFGGSIGIAPIGYTRLVSKAKPTDTGAFTLLFPLRLGIMSIPAKLNTDGTPTVDEKGQVVTGRTAFSYSANVRVENEVGSGNFEGAYFEIGWGESEQFSRKKYPRIRADGLLPIGGSSGLFRFATRVQIDAPRPLARRKENDLPDNLTSEIRISILLNMDLLELAKRIGK